MLPEEENNLENDEVDNTDNNNNNNDDNNNDRYRGRHINFKILGIIACGIIIVIIFNIFKTPETKNKSTIAEEKVDIDTKVNPYQLNYGDINRDSGVRDVYVNNNTSSGTSNNSVQGNNQNDEEERERLRRLREEAEQAKRSSISFPVQRNVSSGGTSTNGVVEEDYDLQNRQISKKNFLMNEKAANFYSTATIVPALSPYEIKAGDFIPIVVITGMNSDLYSKVIVAQVTQNIFDTVTGKYLLVPQGTVLTGVYDSNVTWGQERLLVIWQRMRFPNGSSIRLDNIQGVDLSGQAGITGKVNNHFATLLKGVLLSSAMGATAAIVTDNDRDNWRSAAGQGAGQTIVEIGDKFATKALDRPPTIEIKAGDRSNVMIHSDIILKPYK